MANELYANRTITFAVIVYDTDGVTILPGSTWLGASYNIFPADTCTAVVTKTLGAGITASSVTESFFVKLEKTDLTVSGTSGEYIHSFTTELIAGEPDPDIFYEVVPILARCIV